LLILLAVLAASMVLATRQLIVPFPQNAAWFESSALFPSLMLALAAVGAMVEAFRRRLPQPTTGSDELDASQARIGLAVAILGRAGATLKGGEEVRITVTHETANTGTEARVLPSPPVTVGRPNGGG
jgi:hypothetical protein